MKKVLIIGAGFLQSFVIKKAKELGYYTMAVDLNPHAEGFSYCDEYAVINITDEHACYEYAQKKGVDGVLTAATDYGVLTAAYIADKMGLPGIGYETAKLIKNKYLVRKRLFESGADDMEQCYEINVNTNIDDLKSRLNYPVMVKPCDGSGSRGASKVEKMDDLEKACEYAINSSITRRAEIEPFISGTEYGAETLVVKGKPHVLAIMKKHMTKPPYYAELGHTVPSGLDKDVEEKVKTCVEKAIKALGINMGSVNMDMLITKKGRVYIVDIGARMGGNLIGSHIIPYGTGIDYMSNMIRNAVGDTVDLKPSTEKKCVATRIMALTPGKILELPEFEKIEKEYNVAIVHHLKKGDIINEYRTNLDGCGYVVAVGERAEDVAEQAKNALDYIIKREDII